MYNYLKYVNLICYHDFSETTPHFFYTGKIIFAHKKHPQVGIYRTKPIKFGRKMELDILEICLLRSPHISVLERLICSWIT
jgi:hypothetical protein